MKRIKQILFFAGTALFTISCNTSAPKTAVNQETKSSCCEKDSVKSCCSSQEKEVEGASIKDTTNTKVMVYYFHGTRRCATCEAVESVTKETIDQNFTDGVGFASINRENETELAERFKVSGQTLLIVCGDKTVNLTNEAFLNARSNPGELVEKIKSVINSML